MQPKVNTPGSNIMDLPATPTMSDIEVHTKNFAFARQKVVDRVTEMNEEIEAIKRKHMRYLKSDVARAKEEESHLAHAVSQACELFENPKSHIFHGIKVGLRKKVGKLDWDDDAKVCERIKKNFPKQYDTMVKVIVKPIDKALKNLQADDLLKLGITLGKDTDEVVIAAVDSEVDKLVDALLKDSDKYE